LATRWYELASDEGPSETSVLESSRRSAMQWVARAVNPDCGGKFLRLPDKKLKMFDKVEVPVLGVVEN